MRKISIIIIILITLLFSSCTKTIEKLDDDVSGTMEANNHLKTYLENQSDTDYKEDKSIGSDVNNEEDVRIEDNKDSHIFFSSLEQDVELSDSTVDVKITDMVNDGSKNNPVKVTLTNQNIQVELISEWNDGIKIGFADFSDNDNYKNIYVTELGTDIQCITHVFKYNESVIIKCFTFKHLTNKFLYDGKGSIYYYSQDIGFEYPDTYYDYDDLEEHSVEDIDIINELMNY